MIDAAAPVTMLGEQQRCVTGTGAELKYFVVRTSTGKKTFYDSPAAYFGSAAVSDPEHAMHATATRSTEMWSMPMRRLLRENASSRYPPPAME